MSGVSNLILRRAAGSSTSQPLLRILSNTRVSILPEVEDAKKRLAGRRAFEQNFARLNYYATINTWQGKNHGFSFLSSQYL
jgi:hypothetical protein